MKLFGRNKDRPLPDEYCCPTGYELESKRVLRAVVNEGYADMKVSLGRLHEVGEALPEARHLAVGAEEHWVPFDSIFQEVAFNGSYPDIFEFLCKTNSKVVFDD